MIKIKLLKQYHENKSGEIINVSNNVAFGLVDSGVAKYFKGDLTVKTPFGNTKAINTNESFYNPEVRKKRNNYRR